MNENKPDNIKASSPKNQELIDKVVAEIAADSTSHFKLTAEQDCLLRARGVTKKVRDAFVARRRLANGLMSEKDMGETIQDLYLSEFKSWSKDDLLFIVATLHTMTAMEQIS